MAVQVARLSHTLLNVTSLSRSKSFYTDVLDFRCLFETELPGGIGSAAGMLAPSGMVLELLEMKGKAGMPRAVDASRDQTNLAFSVTSIEDARAALESIDIPIRSEMEISNVKMIFIQDPDGRSVEFAEFPDGALSTAEMYGAA